MPTRNVLLADYQASLVKQLVDSGCYENASKVLREALRSAVQVGIEEIAAGRFKSFKKKESLRAHLKSITDKATAKWQHGSRQASSRRLKWTELELINASRLMFDRTLNYVAYRANLSSLAVEEWDRFILNHKQPALSQCDEKLCMQEDRLTFEHPNLPIGYVLRANHLYRLSSEEWVNHLRK